MIKEDSLLNYVKPFVIRFICALVFMAMVALFTVMLPLAIEPLINELSIRSGGKVSPEGQQIRQFIIQSLGVEENRLVPLLPTLLLVVFLGQAIFTFLSLYFMKTLGLKVIRNIRDKLYRNLVHQSVDFLSKAKTGDLTSRISNDIEKIRFAVSETLAVYIRETLSLLALMVYVFF
jgi:subfamily B ATP-binding cassette protein MsbA